MCEACLSEIHCIQEMAGVECLDFFSAANKLPLICFVVVFVDTQITVNEMTIPLGGILRCFAAAVFFVLN